MLDQYGRKIDYLRISVTDRCNLRCRYCMPEPIDAVQHADILRYEEILRICRAAAELGITKFKVTGGEPLVRAGCAEFIAALKNPARHTAGHADDERPAVGKRTSTRSPLRDLTV